MPEVSLRSLNNQQELRFFLSLTEPDELRFHFLEFPGHFRRSPEEHGHRLIAEGLFKDLFIQPVRFPKQSFDPVSVNRFFEIFFGNRNRKFRTFNRGCRFVFQ